jgi:ribonuclease BN (tRNA processing enzyme)
MKLTVIGCAGSYPSPESPASCYLIEHDGEQIVLDMGNGSLGQLQRHVDPVLDPSLCGVVLSHCHIDHCADVGALYVMRHYGPARPSGRLDLLGPNETRERLAGVYGMADPSVLDDEFVLRPFVDGPMTLGPFEIQAVSARHPVESYSLRVSAGGRSITYSGDTGPSPALPALAAGTDLALFEASFRVADEGIVDLHMSGADAARAATAAGAGLLVLTHLVTWNDNDEVLREAQEHFSGPIERAEPGMSIAL